MYDTRWEAMGSVMSFDVEIYIITNREQDLWDNMTHSAIIYRNAVVGDPRIVEAILTLCLNRPLHLASIVMYTTYIRIS